MIYSMTLIIHLFCSIIFIGFVFAELMVLPVIKKVLREDKYQIVMNTITTRARKIYPFSVLILFISGGIMSSSYLDFSSGIFNSHLQTLLIIKILLALIIASGIIYSLIRKLLKKEKTIIMKHFHKFVFFAGILIIIIAKIMFVI